MPILGIEDRSGIGKLVANTYRSKFGKMPKKRTLSIEQGGKFNVQYYPAEFIPEMDRIIRLYSVGYTSANFSTRGGIFHRGNVPHGKNIKRNGCVICTQFKNK